MADNNKIQQLTNELLMLIDTFIFPEYYSHSNAEMWKVLNPYTKYAEDKMVLCKVEEGIEKALTIAVKEIKESKVKYENYLLNTQT